MCCTGRGHRRQTSQVWVSRCGFPDVRPKVPQGADLPGRLHPPAQPLCPPGNLTYLHRSFAGRYPNSSPGSASGAGCAPQGPSSPSGNLPRHGGGLRAAVAASLPGGTSPPALWGGEGTTSERVHGFPELQPGCCTPTLFCLTFLTPLWSASSAVLPNV